MLLYPSLIYSLNQVKKLDVSDENDISFRCATLRGSKIQEVQEKDKFAKVKLGQFSMETTVIGFTDINLWFFCEKHNKRYSDSCLCIFAITRLIL